MHIGGTYSVEVHTIYFGGKLHIYLNVVEQIFSENQVRDGGNFASKRTDLFI